MEYPNSAEFAFTIVDDTDDATVANASPFYRLLTDLGMRTTKTVWPFAVAPELQGPYFAAETLANPAYLAWVQVLVSQGFEIASHNASMGSCTRDQTVLGLEIVKRELGVEPRLHCNHGQNRENLYWGVERFRTLPMRVLGGIARRKLESAPYEGHCEGSKYFWGDVAKRQFSYVRSFAFSSLTLDHLTVPQLYRDPKTPWVNSWFLTADAPDASAFVRILSDAAIDRMVRRGSVAIISTHVGKGFVSECGEVQPEVRRALERVAARKGWFVPASTILDHLASNGIPEISLRQQLRLETQHVLDRLRTRGY